MQAGAAAAAYAKGTGASPLSVVSMESPTFYRDLMASLGTLDTPLAGTPISGTPSGYVNPSMFAPGSARSTGSGDIPMGTPLSSMGIAMPGHAPVPVNMETLAAAGGPRGSAASHATVAMATVVTTATTTPQQPRHMQQQQQQQQHRVASSRVATTATTSHGTNTTATSSAMHSMPSVDQLASSLGETSLSGMLNSSGLTRSWRELPPLAPSRFGATGSRRGGGGSSSSGTAPPPPPAGGAPTAGALAPPTFAAPPPPVPQAAVVSVHEDLGAGVAGAAGVGTPASLGMAEDVMNDTGFSLGSLLGSPAGMTGTSPSGYFNFNTSMRGGTQRGSTQGSLGGGVVADAVAAAAGSDGGVGATSSHPVVPHGLSPMGSPGNTDDLAFLQFASPSTAGMVQ